MVTTNFFFSYLSHIVLSFFFFCTRSLSITFRCKTLSKSSIEAKRLLFTKVQVHSPRITIFFFLCSELKGAFTVCPKTALQCDRRYLSNNYDEGGFFFQSSIMSMRQLLSDHYHVLRATVVISLKARCRVTNWPNFRFFTLFSQEPIGSQRFIFIDQNQTVLWPP